MSQLAEQPRTVDALLARIAHKDRAALAALFDQEAGRLMAVARRIVRRPELAEDVVQDAFVSVWQRAGQFDPTRGNAVAWLSTIVRYRALNVLRDGSREDLHDDKSLSELGDRASEAFRALDLLAERDSLRRCLGQLEEPKRRAILLCYVTGLNHGEVAATLDAPLGTIKAWIRRGVIALQECLS